MTLSISHEDSQRRDSCQTQKTVLGTAEGHANFSLIPLLDPPVCRCLQELVNTAGEDLADRTELVRSPNVLFRHKLDGDALRGNWHTHNHWISLAHCSDGSSKSKKWLWYKCTMIHCVHLLPDKTIDSNGTNTVKCEGLKDARLCPRPTARNWKQYEKKCQDTLRAASHARLA